MKKAVFLSLVALILIGAGGYFAYIQFSHVEQDFSVLQPYLATERYSVLLQRIQSKPVAPEGFTFVVMGDSRSNYAVAEQVFQEVAKEAPLFVVGTGDIIRGGRVEELIAHHLPLVKMLGDIPFITVPGNHEDGPNRDFAAFKELYGGTQFSFDYGNCRFVGINNCTLWKMTNANLAYLDKELSKPGVHHKFVFFHMPPKNLDITVDSEEGRGFSRNFKPLCALLKHQKVDQVFMGHIHGFATTLIDGVRFTITAGGGANLAKELPKEGAYHNYVVVHVSPTGLRNEVVKQMDGQWVRSGF
ncbi:MAG TPA: metallophosphoesterase [Candidatus Hydrogenedentes bacterium]|nr:metallophosphoesterase [Candidatus Hydrogenedentota bacterium]